MSLSMVPVITTTTAAEVGGAGVVAVPVNALVACIRRMIKTL